MATTQTQPRAGEFKPEYGAAEVIAFKFIEGKNFEGSFGPRVMFTLSDERKFWCDSEDGSDIERRLRELGVERNELVRVTKIRHPKGGGHSFRVEPVTRPANQPIPSALEAQLSKSVEIAQEYGAAAFVTKRKEPAVIVSPDNAPGSSPGVNEPPNSSAARRLMSCFCAAIDAVAESQTYADRKGVKIAFTAEDIRCIALSVYINQEKAALAVRY